jgi:hypothetical protein
MDPADSLAQVGEPHLDAGETIEQGWNPLETASGRVEGLIAAACLR